MQGKARFCIILSSGKQSVVQNKGPLSSLQGIKIDADMFRQRFKSQNYQLIQTTYHVEGLLLPRASIIKYLQQNFKKANNNMYLFYSGHGQLNTGNLAIQTKQCPTGDNIGLQQIINLWNTYKPKNSKTHLYMFLDSCYSAHWCYRLSQIDEQSVSIFASADRYQPSRDNNGGVLLKCILKSDNFDKNYKQLTQIQTPIFINKTNRASKLSKQHLKILNEDIFKINQCNKINGIQQQKYQGQKNKQGQRQGHGTCQYANGNIYKGSWKSNKQQGYGILTYKDGEKYQGQFINGNLSGKGILYLNDSTIFQGIWKDNKIQGKGKIYFDINKKDRYKNVQYINGNFRIY